MHGIRIHLVEPSPRCRAAHIAHRQVKDDRIGLELRRSRHRANPVAETLHRSDKDAVKAEILSAGFTFDSESKVLANTTDDHTKAVNDPSLHDKTDQFALRFKKPANGLADKRPKGADPLKNYYENTYIYSVGPTERHHFYHADGAYEEFGKDDMQQGVWFWDAAGHFCLLHQTPAPQRQYNFCAPDIFAREVGETWTTYRTWRGTTTQKLVKGHVYP